jgi:hypothetical protein
MPPPNANANQLAPDSTADCNRTCTCTQEDTRRPARLHTTWAITADPSSVSSPTGLHYDSVEIVETQYVQLSYRRDKSDRGRRVMAACLPCRVSCGLSNPNG